MGEPARKLAINLQEIDLPTWMPPAPCAQPPADNWKLPTFLQEYPAPTPTTEPTLAGGSPGRRGEMPQLLGERRRLASALALLGIGMTLGSFWTALVMWAFHHG